LLINRQIALSIRTFGTIDARAAQAERKRHKGERAKSIVIGLTDTSTTVFSH
jgi:hypothetical protein